MSSRRFQPFPFAPALLSAATATAVGWSGVASAQTTTGTTTTATTTTITVYQEQSLPRYNSDHSKPVVKRGLQYTPEGINFQDCIENQQIEFPLQLSGFQASGSIQVWATTNGTDCSQQTNRTGAIALCWQLNNKNQIPLGLTEQVYINVRDIMSGASPNTPMALRNDIGICGLVDLNTISVEFLYFPPGSPSTASVNQTVTISVDTVGPAAPSGIHTLPGDTRLYIDWDNISGEGGVSALTGVKVYCDDEGSTALPSAGQCATLIDAGGIIGTDLTQVGATTATTDTDASTTHANTRACIDAVSDDGAVSEVCNDAGTTDAGDAAATSTSDGAVAACQNSNLSLPSGLAIVPTAAFDSCFLCGTITGNTGTGIVATSLRGSNLVDDHHYAVAVAATDAYQNVGPLSSIYCDFPELTNDFWRNYKDSGGDAGGCDTAGDTPLGSMAALGGGLVLGLSLMRRRKKEKR